VLERGASAPVLPAPALAAALPPADSGAISLAASLSAASLARDPVDPPLALVLQSK
jgi:hypothetical protein